MREELVWKRTSTDEKVPGPVLVPSRPLLTKVHALGVVALQQTQQKVPQVVGGLSGNTGRQHKQSDPSSRTNTVLRPYTHSGLRLWFFS